nr:META domain-containing protein [Caulobacter radicis]
MERIDDQPVVGKRPVVTFDEGQVSAGAGCNSIGGPYDAGPGRALRVSSLDTTLVACLGAEGERSMRLEDQLGARLGRVRAFERKEGRLRLVSEPGELSLVARPRPARSMEGDWRICAWPAARSVAEPLRIVRFHDGVVDEWAGCRGIYRLSGPALHMRFDPTPACKAAMASARDAMARRQSFNEDMPRPDPAILAAALPRQVRFTHAGPVLRGDRGEEIRLCRADAADLVPRAAWTLEGRWMFDGGVDPRVHALSFERGVVTETGGCRGRYSVVGEQVRLEFPAAESCTPARSVKGGSSRWRAVLPSLAPEARLRFHRFDSARLETVSGEWLYLRRAPPPMGAGK